MEAEELDESPEECHKECDNCGYETTVTYYEENVKREGFWFCEICANTHLSKAVQYPGQCTDTQLYKSIGWIANRILDEIRAMTNAKEI